MGKGAATVLHFWTDSVPTAAWVTIFWVVIVLVNAWTVKFFGEIEVVSSTIKFGWMFIVVISLIGLTLQYQPCSPNRRSCIRRWRSKPQDNGLRILELDPLHQWLQRIS